MKVYVACPRSNRRIYLKLDPDRPDRIPGSFIVNCPFDGEPHRFHKSDVKGEAGVETAVGGAAIGGLIGLIGGPLGIVLGAIIGGALGYSSDAAKTRRVSGR